MTVTGPLTRASKFEWRGMKNALFDQHVALSRKLYKMGQLLRNANRKPYFVPKLLNGTIIFSDFKVTPLFDAEYLRNGTRC